MTQRSQHKLNGMAADLGRLADRTFDAVIFDMDETLIASMAATVRCWTQLAVAYGLTEEDFHNTQGMPSEGVIAKLLPAEHRDEALAMVERLEQNDYADVVALPGAERALTTIPPDRAAIATSATDGVMRVRLTQSKLPLPDAVVTRDMVERGKPHPDPFLLAAELLGAEPTRCLVVEDAPAGIAAGRAAGASTLAILTTAGPEQLADADGIITNLADVDWVVDDDGVRVLLR